MRIILLGCLFTFLCTCGRAPEAAPSARLTGTLRYQKDGQLLEASLNVSPADSLTSTRAPTLFGTVLESTSQLGAGRYRARRRLELPPVIRLTAPCPAGDCPLTINFIPPYLDSLPTLLNRKRTLAFPYAAAGLAASESVVLFFEPEGRSAPHRIQLIGPTDTGVLTLPAKTLADVSPGTYRAYLIKQQLAKDSTKQLSYSLQTEFFTRTRSVRVSDGD